MKFPKPWHRQGRGWFVTLDGRQVKLGVKRADALERYQQLMAQPQKLAVRSDSLAAIIDVFLEWVQRNRSPHTYEWYRYRLQRFIQRYPDLSTAQLKPFHVETWADTYPLSVTSRRNYLRSVKRCLKWAKKQGYIDSSPIADMEVPSAEHREVAIEQVYFDQLMSYVRNDALGDLFTVTWEIGCRPQELLRVEARHFDVTNQRWVFPKSEEKMKRFVRVIYLTDTALAIVKRRLLAAPVGPTFRNVFGRPWTSDAVNSAVDAIRQRMGKDEMRRRGETISDESIVALVPTLKPTRTEHGKTFQKTSAELRAEAKRKLTFRRAAQLVPRYSLYALRHSWATNALKRGVDPLTVAILMGHKDPSMLAKVYQHLSLSPKHLLDQAKKAAG